MPAYQEADARRDHVSVLHNAWPVESMLAIGPLERILSNLIGDLILGVNQERERASCFLTLKLNAQCLANIAANLPFSDLLGPVPRVLMASQSMKTFALVTQRSRVGDFGDSNQQEGK